MIKRKCNIKYIATSLREQWKVGCEEDAALKAATMVIIKEVDQMTSVLATTLSIAMET